MTPCSSHLIPMSKTYSNTRGQTKMFVIMFPSLILMVLASKLHVSDAIEIENTNFISILIYSLVLLCGMNLL